MLDGISTSHAYTSLPYITDHYGRYADLWEAHLRTALLNALPKAQRGLHVVDNPLEPPMSVLTPYLNFSAHESVDLCVPCLAAYSSYYARSYASRFRARTG